MRRLSELHPAVTLIYFISVLAVTMFSQNPLLLFFSLLGAIAYNAAENKDIKKKTVGFYILLFILITVTNPLFSHKGSTPLFFLNNNPVTMEALLYGAVLGMMLTAVMCWFSGFNRVMSSDKLLYLFGTLSPKLALLLCSALRFIPRFTEQTEGIRNAQRVLGAYASDTFSDKMKAEMQLYSALMGRSIENAIDTGNAMKARGFGLKGRSRYSLYKFYRSDAVFLLVTLALEAFTVTAVATEKLRFEFYPSVSYASADIISIAALAGFALLCLLPFIIEVKEGLLWKYYRSRL